MEEPTVKTMFDHGSTKFPGLLEMNAKERTIQTDMDPEDLKDMVEYWLDCVEKFLEDVNKFITELDYVPTVSSSRPALHSYELANGGMMSFGVALQPVVRWQSQCELAEMTTGKKPTDKSIDAYAKSKSSRIDGALVKLEKIAKTIENKMFDSNSNGNFKKY